MINGTASKFLVAVFGAISTGLTSYYGTARWEPSALAALSAVMVYLVPNSTNRLTTTTTATTPQQPVP